MHLEAPRNKLCVFEIDATTLKIPENMNSYCPYIHLIKPTKKRHTHTHTQKRAKEIPDYKMRKTRTQIMKHALIISITHIVIIERERGTIIYL